MLLVFKIGGFLFEKYRRAVVFLLLLSLKHYSYSAFLIIITFNDFQMAAKPLTTEAIALTEKKMDMTLGMILITSTYCDYEILDGVGCVIECIDFCLDDIIKMSMKTTVKEKKAPRHPVSSAYGVYLFVLGHLYFAELLKMILLITD